jgi:thioredoxin reductase (NADPH)
MSSYLVQTIRRAENVEVRLSTEIVDVHGRYGVEELTVRNRSSGALEQIPAELLLVMIGVLPHTEWLAGTVERDEQGFVLTGADVTHDVARPPLRLETSMPGVFAAGDVRRGSVKRVASAVGEGAVAIQLVQEYLSGERSGEHAVRTPPFSTSPPAADPRGIP